MTLEVWPAAEGPPHGGVARWRGTTLHCALGRAGIRRDKREGDGATPAGLFRFRRVLYRRDRQPLPGTKLPADAIARDDGWCDDPGDPAYNRQIRLPYRARHEKLWRDDGLYDLVLIVGHNDDPPVAGLGSAVFVHLARPDWGPTEGCVAFAAADLRRILAEATLETALRVYDQPR